MAKAGAHLVFLNPRALIREEDRDHSQDKIHPVAQVKKERFVMPWGEGKVYHDCEWLYHHDCVVFDTPVMTGMQSRCLWDAEYYDSVFGADLISDAPIPDSVSIAAFFAGMAGPPTREFTCGYKLGRYCFGAGSVTLSTLRLTSPSIVARAILANLAMME